MDVNTKTEILETEGKSVWKISGKTYWWKYKELIQKLCKIIIGTQKKHKIDRKYTLHSMKQLVKS